MTVLLSSCALLPPPETTPVPGELRITQGTVGSRGGSRLGFIGTDTEGRALLAQWSDGGDQGDDAWSARWRLAPGSVLAAGGEFLRVRSIDHQRRDELVLVPAGDGVAAQPPQPDQPVLSLGGRLQLGSEESELVQAPASQRVAIRSWPKLRPLADTPPAQIRTRELRVGDELRIGGVPVRVERITEPDDGLAPLVVFDLRS